MLHQHKYNWLFSLYVLFRINSICFISFYLQMKCCKHVATVVARIINLQYCWKIIESVRNVNMKIARSFSKNIIAPNATWTLTEQAEKRKRSWLHLLFMQRCASFMWRCYLSPVSAFLHTYIATNRDDVTPMEEWPLYHVSKRVTCSGRCER